jgi:DNA-binding transcriptional LysR family regulator
MSGFRDLPALDRLKAFEAAARLLSFTRAATELHLSQSAVSRQIQQLEAQLGTPLFVRRTRALELTDAGERYRRDVALALQHLRNAGTALRAASRSGSITVTTAMTFASLWLVPRLADFQARHPEIEVRIVADNAVRNLARDRIDLAVRYSTRALAGDAAKRLFGERILPVCSPRVAERHPVRKPADLARCVLLDFADPDRLVPWLAWDAWFAAIGLPPPKTTGGLRLSHYDMVLRAAIGGQGVALGRLPLIQPLLDEGTLIAPLPAARYAADTRGRAYWLIASDEARGKPETQTFMRWVLDEARQAASGPGGR